MEANALVDTMADRIANQVQKSYNTEKVQTFYNTLGEVEPEVLVNKLAPTIAVERVRTL